MTSGSGGVTCSVEFCWDVVTVGSKQESLQLSLQQTVGNEDLEEKEKWGTVGGAEPAGSRGADTTSVLRRSCCSPRLGEGRGGGSLGESPCLSASISKQEMIVCLPPRVVGRGHQKGRR